MFFSLSALLFLPNFACRKSYTKYQTPEKKPCPFHCRPRTCTVWFIASPKPTLVPSPKLLSMGQAAREDYQLRRIISAMTSSASLQRHTFLPLYWCRYAWSHHFSAYGAPYSRLPPSALPSVLLLPCLATCDACGLVVALLVYCLVPRVKTYHRDTEISISLSPSLWIRYTDCCLPA